MMRRGIVFVATLAVMAPTIASAGTIANTKHDLSVNNSTTGVIKSATQGDTCVFCHVSHNSQPATSRPLWSHTMTIQNLTWAGTTVRGTVIPTNIQSQQLFGSRACMSCHDGTVALGDLLNKGIDTTVVGPNAPTGKLNTGINYLNPAAMSPNHPIGVSQPAAATGFTSFKTPPAGSAVNYDANGFVQCDSCHNPHDNAFGTFLKINPAGGAICTTCHNV